MEKGGGREEEERKEEKKEGRGGINTASHTRSITHSTHYFTMTSLFTYLLVQLVGKSIGHHGLPSTWRSMEQHHHAGTIRDGIVQPHTLPAALE